MTVPEVLASMESLDGQRATVGGVLHSDSFTVWLNEQPSEEEEIVVTDPKVLKLLRSLPPRPGAEFAYCFECTISGHVRYGPDRGAPELSNVDYLEIVDFYGSRRQLL